MFTLYLKSADISIFFASSELSSASESKGGIFVIWAGPVRLMKSSASELGLRFPKCTISFSEYIFEITLSVRLANRQINK